MFVKIKRMTYVSQRLLEFIGVKCRPVDEPQAT
jgi:hypothetical protein